MKNHHITLCIASLMLAVTYTSIASAQTQVPQTWEDLERSGYLFMGDLTTPLLIPAFTEKAYDINVLLKKGQKNLPKDLQAQVRDLDSKDEFVSHRAQQKIQPFIDETVAKVKSTKGYIVSAMMDLDKYDFANKRLPIRISLNTPIPKVGSMNCRGAYAQIGKTYLTSCIAAINWSEKTKTFTYLEMDELSAERLKNDVALQNKIGAYFLMEPVGKLNVLTKNAPEQRLGFGYAVKVSAVQPARVVSFLLLNEYENKIIAIENAMR